MVDSIDDLVAQARAAEPPLRLGEIAELRCQDRVVKLELRCLSPHAEWVEIDR